MDAQLLQFVAAVAALPADADAVVAVGKAGDNPNTVGMEPAATSRIIANCSSTTAQLQRKDNSNDSRNSTPD